MHDDSAMYAAIDGIPLDNDGMADQVVAMDQNNVSELWKAGKQVWFESRMCI